MNDPLEPRLRRAAEALDAAAEGWEPAPTHGAPDSHERPNESRRWLVTAGAAATIVAGLVAVAVVADDEAVRAPTGPSPADSGPAATDLPAPATAAPGVTDPPAGDELTAALRDLGVDVDSAPPGATRLDGALFCGVSSRPNTDMVLTPSGPAECMVNYQDGSDPLVFVLESFTTEGDPIVGIWRSEPGRGVRHYVDATRDNYGSGQWSRSTCERVIYQRGAPGINDEIRCDDNPQPAITTTTVPAPANQLVTVLEILGVDVDAAPPGATRLDGEFCGVDTDEMSSHTLETDAQRCLVERYEAGEVAVAVTEWITPEASPVITIYRADPQGVVDVYTDMTRDAVFGNDRWGVSVCDGVTFERGSLRTQGCRDG